MARAMDRIVGGETVEHDGTEMTVVRQQHFACEGPVEVCVELDAGRLDVRLVEPEESPAAADEVFVQIRPDPKGQPLWGAGIGGLLSWLGEQAGVGQPGDVAAEATGNTVIDFTGRRLTVRTPRDAPFPTVAVTIEVSAPAGSSVLARSGSGDITVDGVADRLDATTGSGQVLAQRCTGAVDVRTGSGDVRLGSVQGTLRVRTGSGVVDVVALDGPAGAEGASTVQTGAGNVRFGAVGRDLTAHTGRGDLVVVDASAGRLELTSGSGQLRIGIHGGVHAELDVSSGSGRARSELPVTGPPAEASVGLRVKARTGSGDALVTAASR